MTEAQKAKVIEILDSLCSVDSAGYFYVELFADSRDQLSEERLMQIAESTSPEDTFYSILGEIYYWEQIDAENTIIDKVIEKFTDEDVDQEELSSFVMENILISVPVNHYLNQEICVNIMLDTGDGNYDFVHNQPFASWDDSDATDIHKSSALLWLARQQGYTKEQLIKALRDEDFGGSKFLETVWGEVCNCSTHMHAVTFLAKMKLKKYLILLEAVQMEKALNLDLYKPGGARGKGSIVISKNAVCGLYDPWNGAGSVLEIVPDKDIHIPIRFLDSVLPDGGRGYSIRNIYGTDDSLWFKGMVKSIMGMTQEEVESEQEEKKRESN